MGCFVLFSTIVAHGRSETSLAGWLCQGLLHQQIAFGSVARFISRSRIASRSGQLSAGRVLAVLVVAFSARTSTKGQSKHLTRQAVDMFTTIGMRFQTTSIHTRTRASGPQSTI